MPKELKFSKTNPERLGYRRWPVRGIAPGAHAGRRPEGRPHVA